MPSPTIISTTSSTPAVVPASDTPNISAIAIDGVTAGINASTISTGTLATTLSASVNDHAARSIIGPMLEGHYSIIRGLGYSSASGLNVTFAAGQANINGIVEVASLTITVPDNATIRVWLMVAGSLNATNTYPGDACLLATITTVSGSVTVVDIGGVFYGLGLPRRFTADTGRPTDTPTNTAPFLTITFGGTWLWDGSRYLPIYPAAPVTLTYGATINTDASKGDEFTVTLTGATASLAAPSNPTHGQKCRWIIKQDATGGRGLSLNAVFKVPSTITYSLSTTANAVDFFEAVYSSSLSAWIMTTFQKAL